MSDETGPTGLGGLTPPPTTATPPTTPEATPPATPPVAEPAKPVDPNAPKPEAEKPVEPVAVTPIAVTDLKLPEGFTLDEKSSTDFLSVLNDDKLSRAELAQKLVDLQVGREKAASEQGVQAFNDLQTSWRQEVEKDAEIGGAKLPQTLANIGKVLEKFGSEETRQAFEITGAGNNPHIVRFLSKIGAMIGEGGPVSGSPAGQQTPLEQRLYTKGK